MGFKIEGLRPDAFQPLFSLDDAALASRGARRQIVDHKPGYPCRVSLEDAEPGEEVLLLNWEHHAAASPYRASGPIFVRKNAARAWTGPADSVPAMLRSRLLSVRAYRSDGTMLAADVCDGRNLELTISKLFSDSGVSYLHVHNAKPGCFNCRVDRT
jgi:hypothetical protein